MFQVTPTASLLEIVYTLLSVSGALLMAFVAFDNLKDWLAARKRKVSGYSKLTAIIGVRDSLAAMLFHLLFFYLGVLGLLTLPPIRPELRAVADKYAIGFIVAQMIIFGTQLLNQIDRQRIRSMLRAKPKGDDASWLKRCRECLKGLEEAKKELEDKKQEILKEKL